MTTPGIAVSRYGRTAGLFDSSIAVEGADVRMHSAGIPSDIFEKIIREIACDAAELGLTYLRRLIDAGDDRFVALPAV